MEYAENVKPEPPIAADDVERETPVGQEESTIVKDEDTNLKLDPPVMASLKLAPVTSSAFGLMIRMVQGVVAPEVLDNVETPNDLLTCKGPTIEIVAGSATILFTLEVTVNVGFVCNPTAVPVTVT